ncbi:MAG: MBOAT family O-acyltransferase [Acutalibacteraceae bacterium]|nr:MBOAT family O-acyltransferase [Acutalibacteraceae bacterium]
MVFSSATFLFLFLPAVLILYYNPIIKKRAFRNAILIASSIFFYAWGEPFFVLLMLASIMFNWLFGLGVAKFKDSNLSKAKLFVALSVVMNLSLMFVFKYLTFALENINAIFSSNLDTLDIALPIGISFFTFQAMSYVIDVYRGNGAAQKNPFNVALYIAFFPQLIAGPIVRYQTIAEQINFRKENFNDFSDGVYRFMLGFCKKVLIANNVASIADEIFNGSEMSVATAWIGAIAYTLQIFFDFAGYSEMAIGLGKMFGFHFLENFDYPYISKSVSEFWRRWHISLGSWFRDYVYFPLGGSRVSKKSRLIFNLFVVWLLTGIWHGANWTFVVWGLLYFVLLAFEKLTKFPEKLRFFSHIYTMLFVIIGWVIFRAESLSEAFGYLQTMFFCSDAEIFNMKALFYLDNYKFYLVAGIIACFPIMPKIKEKIKINKNVYETVAALALLATFIISLSFTIKGSYNPFIYFNF